MDFSPLYSPIDPVFYPLLAVSLTLAGILFLAWFFVYEATTTNVKGSRDQRLLRHELMLAGPASVLLGLGTLFVLLWTGVYV